MAAIIEVKESLQDNAEKIVKYANKLIHCVLEMDSYGQRYGRSRRYDDDDYRY